MDDVYIGYAMTPWLENFRSLSSEMICVKDQDERPRQRSAGAITGNTPQLRFVRVISGDEPKRKILECVVCRKVGNAPQTPGLPGPDGSDGRDGAPGFDGRDGEHGEHGAP